MAWIFLLDLVFYDLVVGTLPKDQFLSEAQAVNILSYNAYPVQLFNVHCPHLFRQENFEVKKMRCRNDIITYTTRTNIFTYHTLIFSCVGGAGGGPSSE